MATKKKYSPKEVVGGGIGLAREYAEDIGGHFVESANAVNKVFTNPIDSLTNAANYYGKMWNTPMFGGGENMPQQSQAVPPQTGLPDPFAIQQGISQSPYVPNSRPQAGNPIDMGGLDEPYDPTVSLESLRAQRTQNEQGNDWGFVQSSRRLALNEGIANEMVTAQRSMKVYKTNLAQKAQKLFDEYTEALKTPDPYDEGEVLKDLQKISFKAIQDIGTDFGILQRVDAYTKQKTAQDMAKRRNALDSNKQNSVDVRSRLGQLAAMIASQYTPAADKEKLTQEYWKLFGMDGQSAPEVAPPETQEEQNSLQNMSDEDLNRLALQLSK